MRKENIFYLINLQMEEFELRIDFLKFNYKQGEGLNMSIFERFYI